MRTSPTRRGPSGRTGIRAGRGPALFLVGVVALLVLVAQPLPASGQDAPETPEGVFNVSIGRGDLPSALAGGPGLLGQWRIEFAVDGTYTLARTDVGVVVRGTYEVEGATITLTDEGGILACGGGGGADLAGATYAWEFEDEALRLTPIDDPCDARRLLLSTRTLGGFAVCDVEAPDRDQRGSATDSNNAADADSTAEADATGTPEETDEPAAEADGTPAAGGLAERASRQDDQDDQDDADTEREIDALLSQMTGCWATGDPELFLALHSEGALEEIADAGGPTAEFNQQLAQFMTTPLTFERVGNLEFEDDAHASAFVVLGFGEEQVPIEFRFVREDGQWLLDFFFIFELTA